MLREFMLLTILIGIALGASHSNAQTQVSGFVGLNVYHFEGDTIRHYEQKIKLNMQGESQVYNDIAEYKLNEGFIDKNQLIGLNIESEFFSLSLMTMKNSFHERSYAINPAIRFKLGQVSLYSGMTLITGYKRKYIYASERLSEPEKKESRLAPTITVNYRVSKNHHVGYSLLGGIVGILTYQYKIPANKLFSF